MENSNISWTDNTWNPWIGCRHLSAECDHCYADAAVTWRMKLDFNDVHLSQIWRDPLKWNREAQKSGQRSRVFCASYSDFLFKTRTHGVKKRGRLSANAPTWIGKF
jgi:protein gp37